MIFFPHLIAGRSKSRERTSMRTLGIILILFSIVFIQHESAGAEALLWGTSKPARRTSNRFNYDETPKAQEVSSFWAHRKMSVGIATAGAYGIGGALVAFHFHPQWSVDMGFGGGSHFQSFGFRVKRTMLKSSPLNPYFALGFQRWERGTSRPINPNDIRPGYVATEFMSEEDRRNGHIDEKLIHGSLGLQYIMTQGEWAGYGLFLEALYLVSAEDLQSAPTASFGMNYYF